MSRKGFTLIPRSVIVAVVVVLGIVAIAVVVGSIVLASQGTQVPDALIGIGAGSVTALAAILPGIRAVVPPAQPEELQQEVKP